MPLVVLVRMNTRTKPVVVPPIVSVVPKDWDKETDHLVSVAPVQRVAPQNGLKMSGVLLNALMMIGMPQVAQ